MDERLGADSWPGVLGSLVRDDDVPLEAFREVMRELLQGGISDIRAAALLTLLAAKNVSGEQLAVVADEALAVAVPVPFTQDVRDRLVDTCGTGGTRHRHTGAVNVSTMAGIVAAGAGALICKHGNRKITSTSGSFDMMAELGVSITLEPDDVVRCLEASGMTLCLAPLFHPAFKALGPIRAALPFPTVFNILGPLINPARVRRQVIGVRSPELADLMASAISTIGTLHTVLVWSEDGHDELSLYAPTHVTEVTPDGIRKWTIRADEDLGLRATGDRVAGGDPRRNADLARELLSGAPGPVRDIVAANAALALLVSGRVETVADGLELAYVSIDSGAAGESLRLLSESSAPAAS